MVWQLLLTHIHGGVYSSGCVSRGVHVSFIWYGASPQESDQERRVLVIRVGRLRTGMYPPTGCNDISKQKTLASAAAQRFQTLYNTDSCEQLYEDASHYFQSHETRPRWLRDCAELRTRFGPWSEFTPATNNSYLFGAVGNVWVRGPAHFLNGEADVRLDWDLTTDHPALSQLVDRDRRRPDFYTRFYR